MAVSSWFSNSLPAILSFAVSSIGFDRKLAGFNTLDRVQFLTRTFSKNLENSLRREELNLRTIVSKNYFQGDSRFARPSRGERVELFQETKYLNSKKRSNFSGELIQKTKRLNFKRRKRWNFQFIVSLFRVTDIRAIFIFTKMKLKKTTRDYYWVNGPIKTWTRSWEQLTQSKAFPLGINSNLSQRGWGVSFLRERTRFLVPKRHTGDTTRWYVARAMTSQSGESEIRLSYLARASTRGLRRGVRHVSSRGSKSKVASWHAPATNVRPRIGKDRRVA